MIDWRATLEEYILQREYKIILIAYVIMQLTSSVGAYLTSIFLKVAGIDAGNLFMLASVIWLIISFSVTALIVIIQLRKAKSARHPKASAFLPSVFWAIFGVFLVLIVQGLMIYIESLFGIEPGSKNTEQLLLIIEQIPLFNIVIIVLGPFLEEIVFRKIIFGYFYQRSNALVAAIISACLFSIAHMELEHFLLYTGIGLVFAFLYFRTKRIIVPVMSHILMNAFVVMESFLL